MGIFSLGGAGTGGIGIFSDKNIIHQETETAATGRVSMKVFPNPTKGRFSIELTSNVEKDFTFSVIDQNGHLLQRKKIHCREGNNVIPWDISSYAAGVYFIIVENTRLNEISFINE